MDSSGSAMEASFIKSQVCGWPEPRQLELIVGELTGTDQPGELCLARLSGLAGPVGGLLRIQLDSGECDEIGDDVGEADLADRLRRFCRSDATFACCRSCAGGTGCRLWRGRWPACWAAGPARGLRLSKRHQLRRILPIEPVATELCIRFCKQPKQSAASVAMTNRLLADLKHCIGQDPNFSHLALTGRLKNCKLHQGDCAYYRCQLMASAIFDAFRDVVPPPPPPTAPPLPP
uniref:FERM domain-containing protein n=1 Tax=Macrostomum lignano TaxID=282301 RepID=A0A1I8FML5_9PLAT